MATINTDDLLTTAQAAEQLELAIESVTKYCSSGKIKAQKIGWIWMVPKKEVIRFKQSRRPPGRPNAN